MSLLALRAVFLKPAYAFLAVIASVTVFAFSVWLPNISLLVEVMGHAGISVSEKAALSISLLGAIGTNFSLLSAAYTIAIAILFGMNIATGLYLVRNRIAQAKRGAITPGVIGLISGVLGVGCAACGSVLISSALSLVGAAWILSYLPLAGGEFGILGVILLSVSLFAMAKKIESPAVCKS